jgi:hypothetical protein
MRCTKEKKRHNLYKWNMDINLVGQNEQHV